MYSYIFEETRISSNRHDGYVCCLRNYIYSSKNDSGLNMTVEHYSVEFYCNPLWSQMRDKNNNKNKFMESD